MGAGRPTLYSDELSRDIVFRMISGESLKSICRDESMPARSTILNWVAIDHCGFMDTYIKACEARAYGLSDDIIDISDDGTNDWMENNDPSNPGYKHNGEAVNRSRLRVDSRKWLVSKLLGPFKDKPETKKTDEVIHKIEVVTVGANNTNTGN